MYAYCGNNPINRADPSGNFFLIINFIRSILFIKETFRVRDEIDSIPEPIEDITESFRETLRNNANIVMETTRNEGIVESSKQFYYKVRNKGEWDLKQFPEYKGPFMFNDRVVEGQDLGNINFGYTGSALGLSSDILLAGAGAAQIVAGTSNLTSILVSNGDDLRDQMYIGYGIKLYYEDHSYFKWREA